MKWFSNASISFGSGYKIKNRTIKTPPKFSMFTFFEFRLDKFALSDFFVGFVGHKLIHL